MNYNNPIIKIYDPWFSVRLLYLQADLRFVKGGGGAGSLYLGIVQSMGYAPKMLTTWELEPNLKLFL